MARHGWRAYPKILSPPLRTLRRHNTDNDLRFPPEKVCRELCLRDESVHFGARERPTLGAGLVGGARYVSRKYRRLAFLGGLRDAARHGLAERRSVRHGSCDHDRPGAKLGTGVARFERAGRTSPLAYYSAAAVVVVIAKPRHGRGPQAPSPASFPPP